MSGDVSVDAFLGGRLRLAQFRAGHRAGTDAALLAACLTPPAGALVADLGAGTGAAGLALAARVPECRVTLVEIDPAAAALARENIAANGLAARAGVAEADLTMDRSRRAAGLLPGTADAVLMNPPFHRPGTVRPSPDADRRRAHMLAPATDAEGADALWMRAAAALLRGNGLLAVVHRADALARLLAALGGRFGDVRILPVQPKADAAATRLLLRARKGSRAPLTLLPPLALHEPDGAFTARAQALHRGEAAIDWGDGA